MRSTEKFIFFWQGFLSQWYMSDFSVAGRTYCCAEQFMMAEKARIFNDFHAHELIMATNSPKEHKALGRKVKGFNEDVWNSMAKKVVYEGNYAKFSQDEQLKSKLIATAPKTLVEGSPYDRIWGIGLKWDDPLCNDPKNWKGKNWLGEVLTNVRDHINTTKKKP